MRARIAVAMASAIAVVVLPVAPTWGSPTPVASTSAPVWVAAVPAIGSTMPVGYDPVAEYEAQAACDPTPKPGTKALAALIRRTYGRNEVIGISRGCRIGGTSEHKEGRALDWMTSVRSRRGFANARAFLKWLLGPDQTGVPFGNATRLGVMYVGWNNRYWAAYAKERGWAELKGCLTKGGDATTCHRNHIHISLSWDGASGRTSLWDGTVLTAYCPSPWSEAPVVTAGRAVAAVPVPPVTVTSTRLGVGISSGGSSTNWRGAFRDDPVEPTPDPVVDPEPTPEPTLSLDPEPTPEPTPTLTPTPEPTPTPTPVVTDAPAPVPAPQPPTAVPVAPTAPCRLHAAGWRTGRPGLQTKVTGIGGVPETGVAAVAVTVTALGSTAPARVSAWSADATPTVLTVRMNGKGRGTAVVPVAADGTIGFSTSAGATDLVVQVTGYYPYGDQANRIAVR